MSKRCTRLCRWLQWVPRHSRWGCFDKTGYPRYHVLADGSNRNRMPLICEKCVMFPEHVVKSKENVLDKWLKENPRK